MITICCTAKLLKVTGFSTEKLIPEPTAALGNWYANILYLRHLRFLLFVSDNSRLAVITPAREVKSLASHLTHQLSALLERLGVSPEWIDAEVREMADVHIGTTRSKSVLGNMNDYKIQIDAMILQSKSISSLEMSINISRMPVGPIQYRSPGEVALDLLRKYSSAG